jgi:hypothetical protein
MPLCLKDYLALGQRAPKKWDPDPFQPHPDGDWLKNHFEPAVVGVTDLLKRFEVGKVAEWQLLHGKDTGREKKDTLSYWLYCQHHPGSEYWKLMGQRYWSVVAWRAWRDWRAAGGRSFPKRSGNGDCGLVSEHVVPKKVLKQHILADRTNVRVWLERNLCCVVTVGEDRNLPSESHRDATDPWLRYEGSGIVLLHNSRWTDAEREPLLRHGLVNHGSFPTSVREES